jgi:signal transduction histidine kinase/ligand-binding sensor domain-containing protein
MHKATSRRRAYCRRPTNPPASPSPCLPVPVSPCPPISASPRPRVSPSPRLRVPVSPRLPVPVSPRHRVPVSPSLHIVALAVSLLLSALCLLPPAPASSQTADVQPTASPAPSPSPSPSPTPVTGLHQWGAVTLFHGLPSDRVRAIAQGPDGSMWFATDAGLAKFDGRRTQAITDSELPAARVLALKTDDEGVLWIGTDSGAARLVGGKFESIGETAGKVVTAIITPERGRAVMATEQGMIFECRTDHDGSLQVRPLLAQPLPSADKDHAGPLALTSLTFAHDKLFAGSLSRGVLAIENGAARATQMRPDAYFIRALETDAHGRLWVGARSKKEESGFYQSAELADFSRVEAPTGTVMAIRAAGEDVWVGTDGRGVFRLSSEKKIQRFTFDGTAGGLRSDHIYSIFVDREEVVWFGTDRGVCRYDPHAPRVESVGNSPDSNFVRTLYQTANGHILAGTNRGLFVYDQAASRWQPVAQLMRNIIYSIAEDDIGRLLIGSASGFYVGQKPAPGIKADTQTFARVEVSTGNTDAIGSIRAIAKFQGGIYIASYGRGVELFDHERVRVVWPKDSASTREVISLETDGNTRLLIGTTNDGVLVFDGQQAQSDPAFAKLKDTAVRSIERTADGTLWFATSRGVYVCRPSGTCILTAPGFDARALLVTQGDNPNENANRVWCATTGAGLLKIALDERLGAVVSQLDAEQGLPSQNVFAVLAQHDAKGDEALLIGTSRGIARYEPGRTPPTLYATRIISKRVHQPGELAAGLSLEYPQNSLLIDVAAINSRTFPEQFQYGFLLSDDRGRIIKQRLSRESQFAMEGLKPGKYRVVARAFTKDLVPSEPLSFGFSVATAPFPWTSTALAVLLALALLALLWAILERARIVRTSAALVDANRELADARLDLANEAERERSRIARDLHDQTLADLRHLLLLTDQVSTNGGTGANKQDASVLRGEIESISQEVRRICEDLSPSVLQNVGFAAALEFALAHAVEQAPPLRKFEYDFVCDDALEEHTRLAPNVQMQIYRITQEAVNNVCRHAGATQVKVVVASSPDGDFILTIEDNGCDFDPDEDRKSDGRGLANMRARASLIDAGISWTKRDGGGTVFTLKRTRAEAAGASHPS